MVVPSALVLEEVEKSTAKCVSLEEAQIELAMPDSVVPLELVLLGRVPLELVRLGRVPLENLPLD